MNRDAEYATWDDAPADATSLADLADDARQALAGLSPTGAVARAVQLCESDWVREAVSRLGLSCCTLLGLYMLVGADGETPWPAVVVRVDRKAWRADQKDRTGYVALYASVHGGQVSGLEACEQPRLQPSRFKGRPGDPPVFLPEPPARRMTKGGHPRLAQAGRRTG